MAWVVSGCASAQAARDGAAPRPNVLLIVVDDLGWADLGFSGSDYHVTPHIDSIAADGWVFTDAYANCANCAPSRAALMSGCYAPRTGVYTVGSPDRGRSADRRLLTVPNREDLDASFVTLAESMRSAGYATCFAGKWHLGGAEGPTSPTGQGFDVNFGGFNAGHPRSYHAPYQNPVLADGPDGEYLPDRLTTEVIGWLEQDRDEPFFVYFPYYQVHTPIQPRADLLEAARARPVGERHDSPQYAAMVEAVDENVGRLLDALEAMGVADDTLVVFTSDNGGHGGVTSNLPLRGSKGMFYEGGIRVPMAVRWPARLDAGRVVDAPMLLFDWYPTLVSLAGGSLPESHPIDGADFAPLLTGGDAPGREAIFWHFPAYLQRYRGLPEPGPFRTTPVSVIRRGDWKLLEFFEDGHVELYHLAEDLSEATDLAAERPERAASMLAELRAWRASVDAPEPTERNPEYVAPGSR